jgi:hypothetical protein
MMIWFLINLQTSNGRYFRISLDSRYLEESTFHIQELIPDSVKEEEVWKFWPYINGASTIQGF